VHPPGAPWSCRLSSPGPSPRSARQSSTLKTSQPPCQSKGVYPLPSLPLQGLGGLHIANSPIACRKGQRAGRAKIGRRIDVGPIFCSWCACQPDDSPEAQRRGYIEGQPESARCAGRNR
jgi:hypothetical protein